MAIVRNRIGMIDNRIVIVWHLDQGKEERHEEACTG